MCWESLSLKFQRGSKFLYEPYIYKPNLWNPPALLFWGGYCAVPLGTRISTDMPSRSPAQVLSERVTAWKAERRSLKRIKIGLMSKLGTVPVLFVLIHAYFINIEWWLLFLKVLSTYSFHQCEQEFCIVNVQSLRKRPHGGCLLSALLNPAACRNHFTKVFYCSFQLELDSSLKSRDEKSSPYLLHSKMALG